MENSLCILTELENGSQDTKKQRTKQARHGPDIVRGTIADPQSLNCYVYVQNNPVMHEDPSGESFVTALAGATATIYAGYKIATNFAKSKATQSQSASYQTSSRQSIGQTFRKTVAAFTNYVKASEGYKAIVKAVKNSSVGKALVQLGNTFVTVLNATQAKAVSDAQKVYSALKDSTKESVQVLNKLLSQACEAYLNYKSAQMSDAEFWNRNDGYFDPEGTWLQDSRKYEECLDMLKKKLEQAGSISLYDLSEQEIMIIQKLVNVTIDGQAGESTINNIENYLTIYGNSQNQAEAFADLGRKVTAEDIQSLQNGAIQSTQVSRRVKQALLAGMQFAGAIASIQTGSTLFEYGTSMLLSGGGSYALAGGGIYETATYIHGVGTAVAGASVAAGGMGFCIDAY